MSDNLLLTAVAKMAADMATFDRLCLAETKRLSNQVLGQDLDNAMRTQEWLFRTYIGSEENHARIDALQAKLAEARRKCSVGRSIAAWSTVVADSTGSNRSDDACFT